MQARVNSGSGEGAFRNSSMLTLFTWVFQTGRRAGSIAREATKQGRRYLLFRGTSEYVWCC
eukprot:scaffold13737_cov66-Skeletonema_marinoi.AAC.1